jgi:hypothetical protein
MTFQIFGTGHLQPPQYRPPMVLPTLKPGAADFLTKFAAEVGIPLAPWQAKLLRDLEETTPAGETCQPVTGPVVKRGPVVALTEEDWAARAETASVLSPGPVVPFSAELVDDNRKDPELAAARAYVAARLRESCAEPLPSAEWWASPGRCD